MTSHELKGTSHERDEASVRLIPSPPSSGERARVRGRMSRKKHLSKNTTISVGNIAINFNCAAIKSPLTLVPLPPKTGGSGTRNWQRALALARKHQVQRHPVVFDNSFHCAV